MAKEWGFTKIETKIAFERKWMRNKARKTQSKNLTATERFEKFKKSLKK